MMESQRLVQVIQNDGKPITGQVILNDGKPTIGSRETQ